MALELIALEREREFATINLTPVQMPFNTGIKLGQGVSLVNGQAREQVLQGIPPAPEYGPGNINSTNMSFSYVSTEQGFQGMWGVETAGGADLGIVSGSFNASFARSVDASSLQTAVVATGMALLGSYTPDLNGNPANTWDPSKLPQIQWVLEIINGEGGYAEFVERCGTHFVGGIIYGSQYNAALTLAFNSATAATKAAGALSVGFDKIVTSGQFDVSFVNEASSQQGFKKLQWQEATNGGFIATGTPSLSEINDNLAAFREDPGKGQPIIYLLYDWRLVPWIRDAALNTSKMPDFSYDNYLNNLPVAGRTLATLDFALATAQDMANEQSYVGSQNQAYVNKAIQTLGAATSSILSYPPAKLAVFNPNDFADQMAMTLKLDAISDGRLNIQVSCNLDGAFGAPSPASPLTLVVNGPTGGQLYGIKVSHGTETWLFGFQYVSFGTVQPVQGMLNDNVLSPVWSNTNSPVLTYSPASDSTNTTTINGVNGGTFPWLSTVLSIH